MVSSAAYCEILSDIVQMSFRVCSQGYLVRLMRGKRLFLHAQNLASILEILKVVFTYSCSKRDHRQRELGNPFRLCEVLDGILR